MVSPESLSSPRLLTLQQAIAAGNTSALAAFWREVSTQGAPLIERVNHDDQHVLVTFLWRASVQTHNVVLVGNLSDYFGGGHVENNQMLHLPQTDLWYKTYQVSTDVRTCYLFSPNDTLTEPDNWTAYLASCQLDPFNTSSYVLPRDEEDPEDQENCFSVLELPQAVPQPWITPRSDIKAGTIELHRLHSTLLSNERRIWVYTPPGYAPEHGPYDLLVLFDGWAYIHLIPTPIILDNLLAEKRLPPLVAVLIDSLSETVRNRELPCYSPFLAFLTQELLPWLRQRYAITSDPDQTIVAGSSYGGLAAAFAGLSAPNMFGNVLSQSGALWWKPEEEEEPEWLTKQYAMRERLPLRWYLDVGTLEEESGYRMVTVNRHLRDVLQAKGYPVQYTEFSGGHEYLSWRGTLAEGLLALMGRKQMRVGDGNR